MRGYPIDMTPDDNGTLLVTCPDLPEVTSFGEDEADAIAHARDAIEEALASRISRADDLPLPSPARGRRIAPLNAYFVAKVELHRALRAAHLTSDSLSQRLGWRSAEITGLLDVNHASTLEELEAAFLALGKRLAVDVRDAA